MCFVLYVGTNAPMVRCEWRQENPGLYVKDLNERERPVAAQFRKPAVQYVGSTSGCGCDFPNVMFQNGEWPFWEDPERDPEEVRKEQYNRSELVSLLQRTGETEVELYGVWDGSFDFAREPVIHESIAVDSILNSDFRFKEGGFYIVRL